MKFDIVDADDLASVNVDDLLIEEIAFEKEESFGAVGGGPVGGIGRGVNVGVDGGDGGEGKNAVAGFGFDDEGGYAVAVFLRRQRDFAHMSGCRAGRVIHRGAEKFGKRQRSSSRVENSGVLQEREMKCAAGGKYFVESTLVSLL